MNRFKNLMIWNRSVDLAANVYKLTSYFPDEEKYGLTNQIRRCAISIGSNIAEGAGRNSNKEFRRFLSISYGSLYELETQIIIAYKLGFTSLDKTEIFCKEINELQKMVYTFSKKLRV